MLVFSISSSKYAPSILLPFRSVRISMWVELPPTLSKTETTGVKIAEKTHQKTRAALKTPAMVPKSCHLVLLATALQAAAISSRGRPVTATNFYPARVSRSELYQTTSNRAVVRDVDQALKEDGLIAVEVPGFDDLNRAVLRAAHECIDSTKTPQATLADGTVRRSLAASRSNNEAGPLDVPETCAPLAAAEVEFRAAVWSVAEAVAARLGAIDAVAAGAPLLKTRDGAPYATVSDIVRAGDHLEHFHSCRAVRKSNPRPRRDVYYTGIARKARPRKPRSTSTRTRAS